MILYDAFTVDGVRRTSDGYLAAFARVARTGVQEYRGSELGRPDLGKVRVYRPESEVFNADALRSFAHRPVTLRHPSQPVTSKNWRRHAGGQTGDEVVRDGEYIRVPMVMMDQALIDAYEKDGVRELSMGYSTDIKWRTGVTDAGEHYDAVQTSIRGNHLAVVPVARGGDQLRIGDAGSRTCPECGADVPPGDEKCPECGYDMRSTNDGDTNMTKLVLDGLTVTVADDQSGAIIEKHIKTLTDQLKAVNDGFDDFKKKKKDDDKELEDAKKVIDTKDGEIAVLKKQVEDAKVTPQALDVMVKARAAVIDKAKTLVDSKYVFDGKAIEQIRKDAVTAKLGDAAKDMNDGAIEGAFAALTVEAKLTDSAAQLGDTLTRRPHGGAHVSDVRDAALAERDKAMSEAWRTPSAA